MATRVRVPNRKPHSHRRTCSPSLSPLSPHPLALCYRPLSFSLLSPRNLTVAFVGFITPVLGDPTGYRMQCSLDSLDRRRMLARHVVPCHTMPSHPTETHACTPCRAVPCHTMPSHPTHHPVGCGSLLLPCLVCRGHGRGGAGGLCADPMLALCRPYADPMLTGLSGGAGGLCSGSPTSQRSRALTG